MKLASFSIRESLDAWCQRKYTVDEVDYWQGTRLVLFISPEVDPCKVYIMSGGYAVVEGPLLPKVSNLDARILSDADARLNSDPGYGHRKILRDLRMVLE